MIPETTHPHTNRWFAPGDTVSMVPQQASPPAGPVDDGTKEGKAEGSGVVVEIFDDAKAPLAYVRFPGRDGQWVFTEDLRHEPSPKGAAS
jgi:hypothetical protein